MLARLSLLPVKPNFSHQKIGSIDAEQNLDNFIIYLGKLLCGLFSVIYDLFPEDFSVARPLLGSPWTWCEFSRFNSKLCRKIYV